MVIYMFGIKKYAMMKTLLISGLMFFASFTSMSQTLEKMQWFNEPGCWKIEGNSLMMRVTPQTDYWRISHYGFTVDDAPFLYALQGGEFEVKVKISGDYKTRFDQAGLMLRIDHENLSQMLHHSHAMQEDYINARFLDALCSHRFLYRSMYPDAIYRNDQSHNRPVSEVPVM